MQPLAYEPITVDGPPEGLRKVSQRASCAMAAEQTGSPARNPPTSPATAFRHRLPMRPAPMRLLRRISVSPSRSEEHTSELQSLMRISYAVFCLKKKNKHQH